MTQLLSTSRAPRVIALDGLRGLAALVVVFHHLSLTLPSISNYYLHPESIGVESGSPTWWLTATPVHLLIAGPEAVIVFFVISGAALTMPTLRNRSFDWFAYVPQRLVRLYVPAVAAVLLAVVLILATPQDPSAAGSGWLASATFADPTISAVVNTLDILFGAPQLNNVLWSLRWEIVFSLSLAVFVGVASVVVGASRLLLATAVSILAIALGYVVHVEAFFYLPVFFLGAIVAVNLDAIRAYGQRLSPTRSFVLGGAVIVASLLLMSTYVMLTNVLPLQSPLVDAARALVPLGGLGLVISALAFSGFARLLSTPPIRWLGRVSFSLYLVHVPIIVAVNALLGPGHALILIVVSFVAALVMAELFARLVELPMHRWSKWVGTRFAQRRLAAPTVEG